MPYQYGKDRQGPYVKWGGSGKKYHYSRNNPRSRGAAKARASRQRKAIKSRGG